MMAAMEITDPNLNFLRDEILLLGGAAESAIARAVRALVERDVSLAEMVIQADDEVDQLENRIDIHSLQVLLQGNTTDRERQFILTVAKTAPILERIADHAVNIARHGLVLMREPQLKLYIALPELARVTQQMLLQSLDALTRYDCDLARATIYQDDQADALFHEIYRQLVTAMQADPRLVRRSVELLFVVKHLERIADYTTNICEMVLYMVEGRIIKGRKRSIPPSNFAPPTTAQSP
jgi:phosphate transport system protein